VLDARLPGRIDEVVWKSSIIGSDDDISIARSTPRKPARASRMRHVALHDFNVGSVAIASALAGLRTSRAHATRWPTTRAATLSRSVGGACHEDHVLSPVRPNLAPPGAITQVWTKMILWTFLRSLVSCGDGEPTGDLAMAKAKSALTCGCPVAAFQKMISGKYKAAHRLGLKDGPLRYGEIRTGLLRGSSGTSEIAPRVLSRELKGADRIGADRPQGLRRRSAQGRVSAHA